jgi:transposase
MTQNFLACDREQAFLMPPSLREWLGEDHLAWFVVDAVDELDLSAFYRDYREDGWGRAAFDPAMMVALLLYAYAVGERRSRVIERRCREDVAFRVIAANQVPDHATIARFRVRHEAALSALFTSVLCLCAEAGLVSVGLIAVDGTKLHANASMAASRSYQHIAEEVDAILAEAAAADARDDAELGERRGDELPPELAQRSSRRARLRAAKERLEGELDAAQLAHEEHLQARAALEAERGRKLRGRKPKAPAVAVDPAARVNVTDPDSRLMRGAHGFVQGYNAQAVTTEAQIILAAELSTDSPDARLLAPMIDAARNELRAVGIDEAPGVVLADGGYWNVPHIEQVVAAGSEVLVNPDASARPAREPDGRKPRDKRVHGLYAHMQRAIASDRGRALYGRRQTMIEPVFAQTKVIRRADRFQRRGLAACQAEWRLIAATHNLLKLWRHTAATA